MSYATLETLSDYLRQEVTDMPSNAERLIERAGELFESVTLGRYLEAWIVEDAIVLARLQRAECAQVEYWISAGETADIDGGIKSYTAGSVSITRSAGGTGSGSSLASRLAPRAKDALFLSGLLNAGVNIEA